MKRVESATSLTVIARSPFHVYYEGEAVSLSATNRIGPFDILPGHADFFSMLTPCEVSIDTGNSKEPTTFEIHNGVLTVRDDQVMLFANI
jgi:F0F1-type ATP synthase epsilon subunit